MDQDHYRELHARIQALEKHSRERYEALQRSLDERHQTQREAISLARSDLKERLETMNEFRAQITAERANYVNRDLLEQTTDSIRDAISKLERRVNTVEMMVRLAVFLLSAVLAATSARAVYLLWLG